MINQINRIFAIFIILIFKLSIVLEFFTCLFRAIYIKLKPRTYVRLNDIFIFNKKTKNIAQTVSFKYYLSTYTVYDYKKHQVNLLKKCIEFESTNDLVQKYNLDTKVLKCTTNKIFEKIIHRVSNNILEDGHYKVQSQPVEKLFLYNPIVLYINIFTLNKKFWKLIFRKEKVRTYYFKLNTELLNNFQKKSLA